MSYAGGCEAYASTWGVESNKADHCSTCHSDQEEGYEMCSADGPDGREYEICCSLKESVAQLAASRAGQGEGR
jgi:hypothetical protein